METYDEKNKQSLWVFLINICTTSSTLMLSVVCIWTLSRFSFIVLLHTIFNLLIPNAGLSAYQQQLRNTREKSTSSIFKVSKKPPGEFLTIETLLLLWFVMLFTILIFIFPKVESSSDFRTKMNIFIYHFTL